MRKVDLEAIGFEYDNTYLDEVEVKCEEYIKQGDNNAYQLRATFQDNTFFSMEIICPNDLQIKCDQLKTLKTIIQLLESA